MDEHWQWLSLLNATAGKTALVTAAIAILYHRISALHVLALLYIHREQPGRVQFDCPLALLGCW